jgi:hypothetical protein
MILGKVWRECMISFKKGVVEKVLKNYEEVFTEVYPRLQEAVEVMKAKKRRRFSHWCFIVPVSDWDYYKDEALSSWCYRSDAWVIWHNSNLLSTSDYLVLSLEEEYSQVKELFSIPNHDIVLYSEDQANFIKEWVEWNTEIG